MDNTCDTQTIRTIRRQYVRYTDNTCDTQAIREIRRQYIATRTRCSVFSHTGICKHVLAANHCKEKRRPEAERRQSLNMKALAKPLYVAKGPKEKGRKRGGASGYRMRTKALEPQRAIEKGSRCGHRKKTVEAKEISKAKASKAKASKAKSKSKSINKAASKSKASKSKPKPKAATPTKTKAKTKASKAPAPLRPMGQYADGSTRFIQERKKRRIQDSSDDSSNDSSEDEETDLPNHPF